MSQQIQSQVPNLVTALTGPLLELERIFLEKQIEIEAWFRSEWKKTRPPFYGSVDIRNAGFKLAPVDTNIFPAGFNNLNPDFMPLCVQALQATVEEICPNTDKILLIPENHTRNKMYFENIAMLSEIIRNAGFDLRIGSLREDITEPETFETPSGKKVLLEPVIRNGNKLGVAGFESCLVLLNNDLSEGIPDILKDLDQCVMPALHLSWAQRLKSEHFGFYEEVTNEFAKLIDIDPWLVSPLFDRCDNVSFSDQTGLDCLIDRTQKLFEKIERKYEQYNIKDKPFVVVKADSGTYGMAVMMIKDPDDLRKLNRKQRKKMAVSKSGQDVSKAIIQEGVYSFETFGDADAVAEPVVYQIGRHVVGGFYRLHEGRGPDENLNSPGMDFLPLAFNKACNVPEESENRFYAYGVIARLAGLAAARELHFLK